MKAKNVLYAAVGAPVVAARKMTDQVNELRGRVSKETASYSEAATKAIDGWAAEGEKVVSRIGEGKVVEEISQKVDLDQAKEQVGKLRDQLEDMLATWRSSFRPEKAPAAAKSTSAAKAEPADKTAAKPAAKKPANKTSAAKTSSAKSGKSSSAAKTSAAKSTAKSGASKAKAS